MIKPHIIVLGNEKGGTGKSTVAMHIIVHLLREGKKVASLDLDGRQGSLTKYIKNRGLYVKQLGISLPMPEHLAVSPSSSFTPENISADLQVLEDTIEDLKKIANYIVIDTPGSDNYLMRAGHNYADTLITPINESLIDLDVLGNVDPFTQKISSPSHYSQTVWEARQYRASHRLQPLRWFVIRNRLSHVDNRNRHLMDKVIKELSKRVSFIPLPGLGERVIYRELFLKGLTMLDLRKSGIDMNIGLSHIAARREIKQLMDTIEE